MLFEIDPIICKLNDERLIKLCNGQLRQEDFMKLIKGDDPFIVQQGKLKYITKEEQEKNYVERNKNYKQQISSTGGASGNFIFDNFKNFKPVYPELESLYEETKKKIEEDKECKGCARGKYTTILAETILKLDPKDRDVNSLEEFCNPKYPYLVKKLRGETININNIADIPKEFFVKKDIPFLTDEEVNNIKNTPPLQIPPTPPINSILQVENPFGIVRDNCFECVRKHLDDVDILLDKLEITVSKEQRNRIVGKIIGHLNEAADEAISKDPLLAERIRYIKLQIME